MIIAASLLLLLIATLLASSNGWSNVLSSTRNELVFADRNRDYGAYVIRREHHRVMLIAFASATALVSALLIAPMLFSDSPFSGPVTLPATEGPIIEFFPPDPVTGVVPPAPPPPPSTSAATGPLEAVDSVQIAIVDTAAIIPVNPNPGPVGPVGPIGPDTAGIRISVVDTMPKQPNQADTQPEYPGGLDALYADLRTVIDYPEIDIAAGREGRVMVAFVVTSDGTIGQVRVIGRGVSSTIDAEAISSLRQLTKRWKPGLYKGENVNVWYSLPISFKLKGQ